MVFVPRYEMARLNCHAAGRRDPAWPRTINTLCSSSFRYRSFLATSYVRIDMVSWGGREGTIQVVIVLVFLGLTFIILSLRLFTRVIVTRNHGPEDWVITAAFVGDSDISTCRVTISDI